MWAIERECPLRNSNNWADPEQTARELRPLQAYSEALQAGRVFDGICLDRSSTNVTDDSVAMGFPLTEIAAAFGDADFIAVTCRDCPANVQESNLDSLAGCFGWFPVPDLKEPINRAFLRMSSTFVASDERVRVRRTVTQGFYALWINSNWHGAKLMGAINLFEAVVSDKSQENQQFLRFVTALRVAAQHGLTVRVQLMPQGVLEGKWWRVVHHCPHCRAQWVSDSKRCTACDFTGNPLPERKRHARGTRPFLPLEKIVGKQQVGEFLNRYAKHGMAKQRPSLPAAQPSAPQSSQLS